MKNISKWKKYKKSWANSNGSIREWTGVDLFFQSWWNSGETANLSDPNQGLTVTWQYSFFKRIWKIRRTWHKNHMSYITFAALIISLVALFK